MANPVIIEAGRSAIGKRNGAFADLHAVMLEQAWIDIGGQRVAFCLGFRRLSFPQRIHVGEADGDDRDDDGELYRCGPGATADLHVAIMGAHRQLSITSTRVARELSHDRDMVARQATVRGGSNTLARMIGRLRRRTSGDEPDVLKPY